MGDSKELVERSNRLGSDPRYTNYAGGNTSAKVSVTDPATGEDVQVMYVKGSGGDLGTLTHAGLAGLYVEKVKALKKFIEALSMKMRWSHFLITAYLAEAVQHQVLIPRCTV